MVETPTAPQATAPMNFSLRTRRPINQLMAAPSSGAKMIRRRRLFSCIAWLGVRSWDFGLRNWLEGACRLILQTQIPSMHPFKPKTKDQRSILTTDHKLKLQNTRIVHIQRFPITKDGNDDSQTHCGLGGGDSHHNEDKQLSGNVMIKARESHKRQIHGIQHQLDAHEHRNHITLDQHAHYADRK